MVLKGVRSMHHAHRKNFNYKSAASSKPCGDAVIENTFARIFLGALFMRGLKKFRILV